VFWAEHQTRGRGRQGRAWNDEPGKDLAVTLKLTGHASANPALLAPVVPAAVLSALEQVAGLRLSLKWPNDLMLQGRKLAGILIDSQGAPAVHLIGIGINVNRTEFPPELRGASTSLALATGREYDREEVLVRVAVGVEAALRDLEQGRTGRLAEVFRDRLGLYGRRVVLVAGGAERLGRLTDLDLESAVLDGGERVPLAIVQRLAQPS
jgi:BirA family biotin operon repressor/biotin-[acetyl-CoA-carboxylase] ligase